MGWWFALLGCAGMVLLAGAVGVVAFIWFWPRTPNNAPAMPGQIRVVETLPAGPGMAAELRGIVAELDRTDPGWRLAEWQARRTTPNPNAATVVLAAAAHLPEPWPSEPLKDVLRDPQLPPDRAAILQVRAELAQRATALKEARQLIACPEGRFSFQFTTNPYETPLKHLQEVRKVARLLSFDVLVRLDDHDVGGALESATALLNAARSISDEPTVIAQLVRLAGQQIAVDAAARVFREARGAPEPALAAYQQLLEVEVRNPLLRTALRADRAILHDVHIKLETGVLSANDIRHVRLTPDETARMQELLVPSHLNFLQTGTQLMAMAEQSPHTWDARYAEIQARRPKTYLRSLGIRADQFMRSCVRAQARLRGTLAAVAVARYIVAHGRPPATLAELVPKFVRELPANPYTGNPLEYRLVDKGGAQVVIHGAPNPSDNYTVFVSAP
jgi:hypothetical protein